MGRLRLALNRPKGLVTGHGCLGASGQEREKGTVSLNIEHRTPYGRPFDVQSSMLDVRCFF